jgi:predicted nucleic acid-binding protein
MKTVLLDSSSAILLEKVGLLEHLLGVYKVMAPEAVYLELTENSYNSATVFKALFQQSKINIKKLDLKDRQTEEVGQELNSLNMGERETIQLFQAGTGDFILLDDGKAAKYCHRHHLPFINALLFPVILQFRQVITGEQSGEYVKEIIRVGRYSKKIIQLAAQLTREDLALFIP